MKRIWTFCLIIAGLILVDQFTKVAIEQNYALGESTSVIKGFFSITYVRNTGAAFGMGAGAADHWRRILFLALPVLVCIYLMVLIWKTRKDRLMLGLAYTLIFAGAVGNLMDRFAMGYVVDFLDFYYKYHHFPAFNVADSSITIGAALLLIDFFIELLQKKNATDTV
ncbi:MAG: signal peptidase II [Deltaproteobacteria bacterium]|nr:MAG: signal peptidase II [Deltaproteobacteria bacterium]